ncbi:hypothetical protein SARC_03606 [Sphaeroforma arctica JP610]|uniref:CENP-V/GFA domain-containing protein n=1 Tax=Sphaeroforma arctica JP610 TaxID=667725 RepID=A0A0L0G550_9EUKA|nr:hypothetical protein SARC_03606 [Sphaeroforma arctica JP610]KNC84150.1 hypothetical protein SARC_03606 [Sphaeroforma arctica JP610]|eukprot:XP_014158052.1 hypothetical protein SARC_03606 [Sphaeroforma arctica JP610]
MAVSHKGSCHCETVKYTVLGEDTIEVWRCNCSICTKKGIQCFTVEPDKFKIIQGEDSLSIYTYNTHIAKHTFCKVCGCVPFYYPRSGGVGISIQCLDQSTVEKVIWHDFDGENWEESIKGSSVSK